MTRNELVAVPTPAETPSWRPISHYDAIENITQEIMSTGLGIKSEDFEVNKNGSQMFGNFVLDQGENGINWTVGVRNSHNKLFSLGIAAGTHVIVCSNLVFSGEFVDFRRHTQKLTNEEIRVLSHNAIRSVIEKAEQSVSHQLAWKETEMSEQDMKINTFDAMAQGILPPAQFDRFCTGLNEERKLNGDTLYSFHGGMTRTMRNSSLFTISNRSRKLNNFMEDIIDV